MKGRAIEYNEQELKWVSDNRALPISELHMRFCSKFSRNDITKDHLHSLRVRKGWKTGRTGCFKKGNIPSPNAGPKGPNKTTFKKGNLPHNWRPIGSTRIDKEGCIEIKIGEPKVWKHLHKILWTAINGDIPKGFCLTFKDGDNKNISLDNLELISRNENLQINRLKKDHPSEVIPVIRTIGKIKAKTIELTADPTRRIENR